MRKSAQVGSLTLRTEEEATKNSSLGHLHQAEVLGKPKGGESASEKDAWL